MQKQWIVFKNKKINHAVTVIFRFVYLNLT